MLPHSAVNEAIKDQKAARKRRRLDGLEQARERHKNRGRFGSIPFTQQVSRSESGIVYQSSKERLIALERKLDKSLKKSGPYTEEIAPGVSFVVPDEKEAIRYKKEKLRRLKLKKK